MKPNKALKNTMTKGENADNQQFPIFPQFFQSQNGVLGNGLKNQARLTRLIINVIFQGNFLWVNSQTYFLLVVLEI